MRVAVIGYGTMGQARSGFYSEQDGYELVAIADPTQSRQQAASRAHPTARVFSRVETLLAGTEPYVVDVCSPPNVHAEQIRLAVDQGCHVICEKPLVHSSVEARRLPILAARAGRVIYPAHNYRFSPAVEYLLRLRRVGALGALTAGAMTITRMAPARGVVDWSPDWRTDARIAGGGILTDHGVHCLYAASELTGCWPTCVACRVDMDLRGGLERGAEVQMQMGCVTWVISLTWDGTERSNRYTLKGTEGSASVQGNRGWWVGRKGTTAEHNVGCGSEQAHAAWLPAMMTDFRKALHQPDHAARRLAEGVATVETLRAAYRSAACGGEWIQLPLETNGQRSARGTWPFADTRRFLGGVGAGG